MELTFTLDQIRQAAAAFWKIVGENKVVAFHGQMGAGKTTFIHALCDEQHVKDIVGSPTFSIINEYQYLPTGKKLTSAPAIIYHMDLYRINNEEEAREAGVQDCLYSGNTCFVEWPEKAPGIFPPGTIHVRMDLINTNSRRLEISDN